MSRKKSEILYLKYEELDIDYNWNLRYDYGDIETLAKQIISNGVETPLKVYKKPGAEKYTVHSGHRRCKAIKRIIDEGYEDFLIPVIVDGKHVSEEQRILDIVILNEGKNLTLLEESIVYEKLVSRGWSNTQIAEKVGKSLTHISNCLLLAGAPEKLKNQIKNGDISASLVIDKLKTSDGEELTDKITQVVSSGAKRVTNKHLQESRGVKFTLENIESFREMIENIETTRNDEAFLVLDELIKWGRGRITNIELTTIFFKDEQNSI